MVLLVLVLVGVVARAADAPKDHFRAQEFQIEGFYSTVTPDFEQEQGFGGGAMSFFPWKNFGLSVQTSLGNLDGTLIDSVSLRGIYRVPINQTALYGYGGSTRLFRSEEWTIDLGGGVEHRFTPNFGPFIEIGMIKLLKHSAEATGRVGLRISF